MDAVSTVRGLDHVAELFQAHDRYLIVPHVQPDPDAFGSTLGLALLLRKLGKQAVVFSDEPMPTNCKFLARYLDVVTELPADAKEWKLIFLDGGERHRQIATVRDWPTWMNLDHHQGNGEYAEHIYVDTDAAATSLIVAQLAEHLGVALDEASASCLFTGILFDTRGGFITDRCDGELFRTVAKLVDAGARPDELNRLQNEQVTMADFQLYGAVLADMKTASDGKVVYGALSRALMDETGGGDQAMEMLTLHMPKIAGGEVYVLFKESVPGQIKISLRSKGRVVVNEIAKRFGGGGHRFAAGARIDKPLAEAIAELVPACEEAVRAQLAAMA
jgi:phosphoesterase RecJ-like protein